MTSCRFQNFNMTEQKPRPVTFEDVFMQYGNLAEIHKYKFDDLYGVGQQAHWNINPALLQYNGYIYPTSSGLSGLTWYANASNLPQSYVVEQYMNPTKENYPVEFNVSVGVSTFTDNQADQGIKCRMVFTQSETGTGGEGGAQNGWFSSAFIEIHAFGTTFPTIAGGQWIGGKTIPTYELPTHGIARCEYYQSQYDLANLTEICVLFWYNDILLGHCVVTGIPQTYIGDKMQFNTLHPNQGFARIGKLSEICPVSSADPGAAFDDAIQLAIQDKYIKYFSRGDGSLRVTVPALKYINDYPSAYTDVGVPTQYVLQDQTMPKWTDDDAHYLDRIKYIGRVLYIYPPEGDGSWYNLEFSNQLTIDYSQTISHVRMLGAFAWATEIDWWLVGAVGNRFAEIQNSAVFSAYATKQEAKRFLRRVREQVFRYQITCYGFVFAEVEDLVLLPGINSLFSKKIGSNTILNNASLWWIDSISWQSVDGGAFATTITLRLNGFIDFTE